MSHYIGQRLSFDGFRCTVRYVGQIKGKPGDWLGVEWDDPSKGKHDGTYDGVKYFSCRSQGSFIRPSRRWNSPVGFLEALVNKYAPPRIAPKSGEYIIGGKTVEQVGFRKIVEQQAQLSGLRVVILDGRFIAGVLDHPYEGTPFRDPLSELVPPLARYNFQIEELDLSRNLLENWADVMIICTALPKLRVLSVSENVFCRIDHGELDEEEGWEPFRRVKNLGLSRTFFDWPLTVKLCRQFPSLDRLTLRENDWATLQPGPSLVSSTLTSINLSFNFLPSIESIAPLSALPCLVEIILGYNPIEETTAAEDVVFPAVTRLDLTGNHLTSLQYLDNLPATFPKLCHLLTKKSPISRIPSASLLTIARLSNLTELNYTSITPADRQNAEIYYLNQVAGQVGTTGSSARELLILHENPRWNELIAIHGMPAIVRQRDFDISPAAGSLATRTAVITLSITQADLAKAKAYTGSQMGANPAIEQDTFTDQFQSQYLPVPAPPLPGSSPDTYTTIKPPAIEMRKLIPINTEIDRLTGIVGRFFGIRPYDFDLILQTEEYDPVAAEDDDSWSVSEDESENGQSNTVAVDDDDTISESESEDRQGNNLVWEVGVMRSIEQGEPKVFKRPKRQKGKWIQREEPLEGGRKQLSDWIPEGDMWARVKVVVK